MTGTHPMRFRRPTHGRRTVGVALGLAGLAAGAVVASTPSYGSSSAPAAAPASSSVRLASDRTVLSSRKIGHSVRGHPIRAYELGSRKADKTVVLIGAMHGDEREGTTVIDGLLKGRPIRGVHIWAVRVDNRDGYLTGHRRNARGVDLNRNFPTRWKRLTGDFDSGPRPASEPETRALMRFLDRVDPGHVVTMHSPLHGIDVYGAKDRPFARRLSREMGLPRKSFNCSGVCHGTLTQWFNRHHDGACVTVEFGDHPKGRYLHGRATRGLLRAIGGRYAYE